MFATLLFEIWYPAQMFHSTQGAAVGNMVDGCGTTPVSCSGIGTVVPMMLRADEYSDVKGGLVPYVSGPARSMYALPGYQDAFGEPLDGASQIRLFRPLVLVR